MTIEQQRIADDVTFVRVWSSAGWYEAAGLTVGTTDVDGERLTLLQCISTISQIISALERLDLDVLILSDEALVYADRGLTERESLGRCTG